MHTTSDLTHDSELHPNALAQMKEENIEMKAWDQTKFTEQNANFMISNLEVLVQSIGLQEADDSLSVCDCGNKHTSMIASMSPESNAILYRISNKLFITCKGTYYISKVTTQINFIEYTYRLHN